MIPITDYCKSGKEKQKGDEGASLASLLKMLERGAGMGEA